MTLFCYQILHLRIKTLFLVVVKGNEFIIEILYLEQLMQSLEVALPNAKKLATQSYGSN